MVKERLKKLVLEALQMAQSHGQLNIQRLPEQIIFERPKDKTHGDFSTASALILGSQLKISPLSIAKIIKDDLDTIKEKNFVARVEVVPPGFINFFLTPNWLRETLKEIEQKKSKFGRSELGQGLKVQLEFVSANPVGPLHLGHGRWAVLGDTLARVLMATGFKVEKEFYINDYGSQMDLFGQSVSAKYCELLGQSVVYPEAGYRGQYITDIAQSIINEHGDKYLSFSLEEREKGLSTLGAKQVLEEMKKVLSKLGVQFDSWFSETTLHDSGAVRQTIDALKAADFTYEKEKAVWFKSKAFGDDKDRVLVRQGGDGKKTPSEGLSTYFAADIAYHRDKLNRGFKGLINIWGADHHGYVKRMQAAIQAFGYPKDTLEVILGQLVNLFRDGKPVRMSKRTGEMVTLEELLDEVGKDPVRFFFLMRSTDTPLDFDIDLAKKRSEENPVYYVQYAHARISSIIRFAQEKGLKVPGLDEVDLELLNEEPELDLIRKLAQFEEVVETAALKRTPYILTQYVRDVATAFHFFYHRCRVIGNKDSATGSGKNLDLARLFLIDCVKIILKNALELMGISAPEKM